MNYLRRQMPLLAALAALLSLAAVVIAVDSEAAKQRLPGPSLHPQKFGLLRLDAKKMYPSKVIPKVKRAKNADKLGGKKVGSLLDKCSPQTVQIGTVCMMSNPFPLTNEEVGKSDYFFATQKCADFGGYLPTAAQLIGAASYVKLAGRLDDNEVTASIDIDPNDGLKDHREMSATLTTTASGSRAAGSVGVSEESRGDPNAGEPDPVPMPANPSPETLQYVTVFDNKDRGGFGGAEPVGQPELFRCAFNFAQGNGGDIG